MTARHLELAYGDGRPDPPAWEATEPARDDRPGDGLLNDEAEITRLSQLSAVAYEREREAAAKRLGCRVAILDRLVQSERGEVGDFAITLGLYWDTVAWPIERPGRAA